MKQMRDILTSLQYNKTLNIDIVIIQGFYDYFIAMVPVQICRTMAITAISWIKKNKKAKNYVTKEKTLENYF